MTRKKKFTVLIAAVAAALLATFGLQTSGVLASWTDAVWGSSEFGRGEWYDGYARGVTGNTHVEKTGGLGSHNYETSYQNTVVSRTQTNTGQGSDTNTTVSQDTSIGCILLVCASNFAATDITGSSSAQFEKDGTNAGGEATAQVTNLNIQGSRSHSSSVRVTESATISANAKCVPGESPTVTQPTGTIRINNSGSNFTTLAIPGANSQSGPVDHSNLPAGWANNATVTYTLTNTTVIDSVNNIASIKLNLKVSESGTYNVYSVSMDILSVECGINADMPALTTPSFTASALSLGTDDENSEASDSEESSEDADSEDATTEEDEDETNSNGPTNPIDVKLQEQFDIIATDGTRLGTATLHEIDNTATTSGGPSTVAIRMTITTSDEAGDSRLATMTADDFRQLAGTNRVTVTEADTGGTALPKTLQPGQTYTGWIAFTVDNGTAKTMWIPDGTAGFTITLPTVTTAETAVPETTQPESTTPETSTPETSAPETTSPETSSPETEAAATPESPEAAEPTETTETTGPTTE